MSPERSVEVRFDTQEYEKLEKVAAANGYSVAALIRIAVQKAYLAPDLAEKRRAIQRLLELNLPTNSWEEVKAALIKERSGYLEAS